jgi:hypothetical protein
VNHRRNALRFLVTAVTAAALLLATAPVASADPVSPQAVVWIDDWTGAYVTVCAYGDVNDGATTVGRWVFSVAVAVVDAIVPQYVYVEDGDTVLDCHTFYAGSPPDAAFTGTLSFGGIGVGSDAAGVAALVYEWNSAFSQDIQITVSSPG